MLRNTKSTRNPQKISACGGPAVTANRQYWHDNLMVVTKLMLWWLWNVCECNSVAQSASGAGLARSVSWVHLLVIETFKVFPTDPESSLANRWNVIHRIVANVRKHSQHCMDIHFEEANRAGGSASLSCTSFYWFLNLPYNVMYNLQTENL